MAVEGLIETKCLFCAQAQDSVVFPSVIDDESFTDYSFSARRARTKQHYRIVACRGCGLVRSDPVLDEKNVNRLYADSCFLFGNEARFAARTYVGLLKDIMADGKNPVSLLDIGCSTGFFMEKALLAGITDVRGFEPSRQCRAKANVSVRDLIISDVFNPKLLHGKKFDIITGFHVIDHVADPLALMISAVDQLNGGGRVMLVCHDVDALSARLLGDRSPIFDIEHSYLFSQRTIRLLFERAGLKMIRVGSLSNTYPLGYWMRLMPNVNRLLPLIPEFVRKIPVRIKAGNLYAWGRKD
jgi:SAM-dependent methyltransferase